MISLSFQFAALLLYHSVAVTVTHIEHVKVALSKAVGVYANETLLDISPHLRRTVVVVSR